MSEATPRLGLIKPAGGEPIDVEDLNSNFDTIDKFIGAISVNDGVVPPDANLFPGCIVAEKTSGWMWMAVPNGVGGYTQKWIKSYADIIFNNPSFICPNWSSGNPSPANNAIEAAKNFTQKCGSASSTGFTPSLQGRYNIWLWANFSANATGNRGAGLVDTDGSGSYVDGYYVIVPSSGAASGTIISHMFEVTSFTLGHRYNLALRQNSGGQLTTALRWGVQLLEPA